MLRKVFFKIRNSKEKSHFEVVPKVKNLFLSFIAEKVMFLSLKKRFYKLLILLLVMSPKFKNTFILFCSNSNKEENNFFQKKIL